MWIECKNKKIFNYDLLVPLENHYLCDTDSLRTELNITKNSTKIYKVKLNINVKNIFIFHTLLLEYNFFLSY